MNVFVGRTLIALFYPETGVPIAAKIARNVDGEDEGLLREHDALVLQQSHYPGLAPTPIAFETDRHFSCLVMQKLAIHPVRLEELDRADQVSSENFAAFMIGRDRKGEGLSDPATLLNDAIKLLPPSLRTDAERHAMERGWGNLVAGRERVPQHGDLAINNVGLNGDAVVVFDWEDYGAVSAAGFDFFVLLISGLDFDYRRFSEFTEHHLIDRSASGWAAKISAGLGIDDRNLYDLTAIFAVIFYGIKCKHGYGQHVRDAVLRFLELHMTVRPGPRI